MTQYQFSVIIFEQRIRVKLKTDYLNKNNYDFILIVFTIVYTPGQKFSAPLYNIT